jgi:hypothetical protein
VEGEVRANLGDELHRLFDVLDETQRAAVLEALADGVREESHDRQWFSAIEIVLINRKLKIDEAADLARSIAEGIHRRQNERLARPLERSVGRMSDEFRAELEKAMRDLDQEGTFAIGLVEQLASKTSTDEANTDDETAR